jgi:alkane 1-monooxygenase
MEWVSNTLRNTLRNAPFRARDLGYLLAYALVTVIFTGNYLNGGHTALGPLAAFGLIPVVDWWLGTDHRNPLPANEPALERNLAFRALLWSWAPVQLCLIGYSAWRFSTGDIGAGARVGMIIATGIGSGGLGITIAHELGHRSNVVDKWCARLLLGSVCYTHFTVEHNRGHHIRVGTPLDPATARYGEALWGFVARNLPQQFLSAWKLENARLRKAGGRALSARNRMIWFSLIPPAAGALFYVVLGPLGAAFFYGQALMAIFLLETVNYIEHYGLVRKEIEPGVYERVTPWHSWNASFVLSNWLLFRLQRHADHHANAGRRYQILRHHDDAPQLPAGYPTMILLALIPPLWWLVMNPRVREVRERCGTWPQTSGG